MSLPQYNPGLPGVLASPGRAVHKIVFRQGWFETLAGPRQIAGASSRDPGNTGDLDVLRPGLLMGLQTSGSRYVPSIIGVTSAAQVATDTSVTIGAAQAVELVRRVGATGTIRLVGPPTAAGTVATFTETYSAVDTTTGVVTTSALDADLISGSLVMANDGSYTPRSLIPDGYGVKVTDINGTSINVPWVVPIAGVILASQIINWPSDTSLRAWLEAQLNAHGQFVFDYNY